MSIALVPVKHLSAGKSRLLPSLTRDELEALSLAMLEDILEALERAESVSERVVVTPDPAVAECARAAGADAQLRPDPGLNESIDAGTAALQLDSGSALLVVLGDVAGAKAEDFDAMAHALDAQLGGHGVVLAPSRDGGTSALLRSPADVIASRFGPQSNEHHREAAIRAEVGYRELALPSLSIDLDRADDVESFLATGSGGARTRALLSGFGWPRRGPQRGG